jgi:hypothetical protein
MEAELPVQVVDGHVRQRAKRAVDAPHNLVDHAAQLLILWHVRAAGHSDLASKQKYSTMFGQTAK